MRIAKLQEKNIVLSQLDKMIMEENIKNEENLSALSELLLMDTSKEDVFLFDNDARTILISIDRINRKEKFINIEDFRKIKKMKLEHFKPEEIKFLVSNI